MAWIASRRIHDFSDYLVAGRNLGVPLASLSLLATWFGAGTLLASAEEVRTAGLSAAALEPIGPGICLLLVGLFYAAPLRRAGLLTLGDFFARRFGRRAEIACAAVMVPSFFGWIAAQFSVLAVLLGELFGIPFGAGLALVAAVAVGYTLIGGMWSVTLTDAVQGVIVVLALLALGVSAGGGTRWGFARRGPGAARARDAARSPGRGSRGADRFPRLVGAPRRRGRSATFPARTFSSGCSRRGPNSWRAGPV